MRAVAFILCGLLAGPAVAQSTAKADALTPDGARYYGPLKDNRLHGVGRLEWSNGSVYEGEFKDGVMSGRGELRDRDTVYEGEFRDGTFHGKGRFEIPKREIYQGEFRQGYYWGQGEITYADGRSYRGEFVRGSWDGKGRHENPSSGEIHEGDFSNSEFTGRGTLSRKDGARYDGDFVNWRFHGRGRATDSNGNIYEGEFVNGELHGQGKLTGRGGESYEGEVQQWRPHGQGVMRLGNGDVYRGGFAHGLYDGEGTMTYALPRPDGTTQASGIWRFGVLDSQTGELKRQASANVEAALYRQRDLLARAISALKPRDPARINLFLLAIAGDGSQEVFRREVEFVRAQFGQRFGTGGRTITLINSRSTVESAPLATVTSIRESLAAIAKRMNKEQDILFVFLTSHGSRTHEFVLNQNGMDLPDLPAAEFAHLLQESGVRWKVVLISACYGGGFAEAVKDESTLAIAAARRDRQSFGCTDENDFTYFGRAYFEQALPKASSFEDAFLKAQNLVHEMEVRQFKVDGAGADERHSLPQMWTSEPIEKHLRRWWAQTRK